MSASHNPGGPKEDWGIKFNYKNGEPAPEKITDNIYAFTQTMTEYRMADIPDVDISKLGTTDYGGFEVEVIDPVSDYLMLLQEVFDFDMIKGFLSRTDVSMIFDALHAVTGAYAWPIFVEKLGAFYSRITESRRFVIAQILRLPEALQLTAFSIRLGPPLFRYAYPSICFPARIVHHGE
mmetsp:Transcript_9911/g.35188  ORF Transcript_9911/g.35188 Transcript_9911/m.35188 type:complete len:179 (+) Transcript_9911:662-1198(+)